MHRHLEHVTSSQKIKHDSQKEGYKEKWNGKYYTIAIEGNVGCGKSLFIHNLIRHIKTIDSEAFTLIEEIPEPIQKWQNLNGVNLLEEMYKDPKKFSFPFQTYVHMTMMQNYANSNKNKYIRIVERSLWSAKFCFVESLHNNGTFSDTEYQILEEWIQFLTLSNKINYKIDHIVYLKSDPNIAFKRMQKRGRMEERNTTIKYIKEIHDAHEKWLNDDSENYPSIEKTVINVNEGLEEVNNQCKSHYEHICNKAIKAITK